MSVELAIIGECMVELSDGPEGYLKKAYSGDSFNTAIYMGRCDQDESLSVRYVTGLGEDHLSSDILSIMEENHVKPDWCCQFAGETPGLYMIHLDDQGERSFSYWRSQAPARKLFQHPDKNRLIDNLMGCDWIYLSGISLAILYPEDRQVLLKLLAEFRAKGGKVCFDINYRPRLWQDAAEAADWIERIYRLSDMALPSLEDELALFGGQGANDVISRLSDWGLSEIVVKSGGDPCTILEDGSIYELATDRIEKMVDTTAAGDSFNAGYLWVRLSGGSVGDAVAAGQKIAAQVIGQKGAIVPIEIPKWK